MLDKMNTEEKLEYIFSELGKCVDREEISEALGYKTSKSMDNLVRRNGYVWDSRRNMYYLPEEEKENRRAELVTAPRGKVREILSLFSKEDSCARDIAEKLEFDNHFFLAQHMAAKGYLWNDSIGNYERDEDVEIEDELDEENDSFIDDEEGGNNSLNISGDYKDLLEYLLEKEKIVRRLIDEKEEIEFDGVIPRYAFHGTKITKSVHMINHLDQLIRDFSRERNISQRELFEVAIVEFFQKYGYKDEIEALIQAE